MAVGLRGTEGRSDVLAPVLTAVEASGVYADDSERAASCVGYFVASTWTMWW